MNAVGLVDFASDRVQVHVCEQCGIVGCSAGGYVRLRQVGDFCVWLADFERQAAGEWEAQQYSPPTYLAERGALLISRPVYEQLRRDVEQLLPLSELRPLLAGDAARILQAEAPMRILGTWPQPPTLHKQNVLAVSEGDLDHECEALQACLDRFMSDGDAAL